MAPRSDQEKPTALVAVSELAAHRLEASAAASFQRFLPKFYDRVTAADLAGRTTDELYGAAFSLWQFAQQRPPGKAKLRVFTPRAGEQGRMAHRSIVEIVNDDMPFLVDFVGMALAAEAVTVHLIIHPVMPVARDAAGQLVALGDSGQSELLMRVEIGEVRDETLLAAITARLDAALDDTRSAVADWHKMRAALAEAQAGLTREKPPLDANELSETEDFLAWLGNDNFTFLGCRDYLFDAGGDALAPGLGIMRDPSFALFDGLRNFATLSPRLQGFLRASQVLFVTKSNRRSTVHRASRMDAIGVKQFDAQGSVVGMRVFLGLFTSLAYSRPARETPFIRVKVSRVIERSGLDPSGHDGKALAHILETFPRDELFQVADDELSDIAMGILGLQERQRVALFVRRDPFGRLATCFVYVPRERYSTALRQRLGAILETAFGAQIDLFSVRLDDAILARVHFVLRAETPLHELDFAAVERSLAEAARSWADKLGEALAAVHGEAESAALTRRYGGAFPSNYGEQYPVGAAIADIDHIEAVRGGAPLSLALYRPVDAVKGTLRFKLYRAGAPCALAEVLPMLEDMGLKAITEEPFEIRPRHDAAPVWMQDFGLTTPLGDIDIAAAHGRFEDAFAQVWAKQMESDGLNRLVLAAGLDWRQVTVLRLYAKAMRQAGSAYSQAYMEDTLAQHPAIAARLVALFEARFDPPHAARAAAETERRVKEIAQELDAVESLDEDRILRSFLRLIEKSLRTNYFQRQPDGAPKPYLSVKLSSREIDLFPLAATALRNLCLQPADGGRAFARRHGSRGAVSAGPTARKISARNSRVDEGAGGEERRHRADGLERRLCRQAHAGRRAPNSKPKSSNATRP